MQKSEEIAVRAAKYNRIERVADSLGRIIGVKRLKPSQQLKVEEFSAGLTSTQKFIDEESGQEVELPRRTILFYAAAVCEIDDVPIPFPKSRADLDAVLDRLDEEGLAAAGQGLIKLNAGSQASSENEGESAKN